jgi:pimeloyl-ACP methyl ester carboxylesterase
MPKGDITSPFPYLVMSHGFSAVKEMSLDKYASYFNSQLSLNILVYDHRGWGASATLPSSPRQELIATVQCSDISDAIAYAQLRKELNPEKVGIWGSSYSGGHVLWVGAADKRVKAVVSQLAMVNGGRPSIVWFVLISFQSCSLDFRLVRLESS